MIKLISIIQGAETLGRSANGGQIKWLTPHGVCECHQCQSGNGSAAELEGIGFA